MQNEKRVVTEAYNVEFKMEKTDKNAALKEIYVTQKVIQRNKLNIAWHMVVVEAVVFVVVCR